MKLLTVLILCLFMGANAAAEKFEPAKIFNIFEPQFMTAVQYNDNIYMTKSEKISSFIYYFQPSVSFELENENNRYGGEYSLTSSNYANNQDVRNDDDIIDHRFSLFADNEFTSKHRTAINVKYENLHEKRGSGLTEGDPEKFDTPLNYNQLNARFYYQFGRRSAKMRIGMGLFYYQKQYNSYISETKYNDLNQLTFSADADYQIGDVTFMTFDILTTDIKYQYRRDGAFIKNNQDNRVLVGLTWRGSSIINGSAKFGYQYKKFTEIEEADLNGTTVDLRVNWSPVERAIYSLDLSQVAEDSDTVGVYIHSLRAELGWRHQWNKKVASNFQYEYIAKDYNGADRNDTINSVNGSLIYGFSRWLSLSTTYGYSVSHSNVNDIGYKQNIFTLSLNVAL